MVSKVMDSLTILEQFVVVLLDLIAWKGPVRLLQAPEACLSTTLTPDWDRLLLPNHAAVHVQYLLTPS